MAAATILDTAAMPWDEQPSGLRIKLLHTYRDGDEAGEGERGARTMILQSPPRAAGASKPHRHNCSEEVFNLGPRMQFDEGQALATGGFMLHPAGSVHGANIDLPQGYRLLVHTPTKAVVEPVATDNMHSSQRTQPVIIADPSHYLWQRHEGALESAAIMAPLSWNRSSGTGSYLVQVSSGGVCDLSDGERAMEVFLLRGTLDFADWGRIGPEGFIYGRLGKGTARAAADTLALVRIC